MWTVRLGQVRAEADVGSAGDVAGVVVLDDHHVGSRPAARRGAAARAVIEAHAGGVLGPRLEEQGDGSLGERRLQGRAGRCPRRRAARPIAVDAELLEEVEERAGSWGSRPAPGRRSGRCSGARRGRWRPSRRRPRSAPRAGTAHVDAEHLVERRAARDRRGSSSSAPRGSTRAEERAEVGQQLGVGGAGREVEAEVAGALGHPPVAASGRPGARRRARTCRGAHGSRWPRRGRASATPR